MDQSSNISIPRDHKKMESSTSNSIQSKYGSKVDGVETSGKCDLQPVQGRGAIDGQPADALGDDFEEDNAKLFERSPDSSFSPMSSAETMLADLKEREVCQKRAVKEREAVQKRAAELAKKNDGRQKKLDKILKKRN